MILRGLLLQGWRVERYATVRAPVEVLHSGNGGLSDTEASVIKSPRFWDVVSVRVGEISSRYHMGE